MYLAFPCKEEANLACTGWGNMSISDTAKHLLEVLRKPLNNVQISKQAFRYKGGGLNKGGRNGGGGGGVSIKEGGMGGGGGLNKGGRNGGGGGLNKGGRNGGGSQ